MILSKKKHTSDPELGDLKVEKRFAWTPTRVGGMLIWLHRYERLYEYREKTWHFIPVGPSGAFIHSEKGYRCRDWGLVSEKVL